MTGTLARYFGLRFLDTLLAVFAGVFALIVLIDYVEMMRRISDVPNVSGLTGRQDLAVSRAADRRADPAVLRADRRDVLLSRPVATARTRGFARGRNVGLAVHRAGRRSSRCCVGVARHHASTIRSPRSLHERSKRLEAEISGNVADRPASDRERLLGTPAQRRRPFDHQRRKQPRAGRAARQRHRLRVRSRRPLSSSASRPRSAVAASPATGGSTTPASMRSARRRASARPISSTPT